MNNKTLKRVVAFLATALLVCSCAFAATIDDATVTYDATTGKIVVPFAPGEGATKAALLVKDASGEIVALAQFNSLKAEGNKFEETIDTTKLANGDTLAISVGDNAATSTSADTAEVVVPAYYTVKWVVEGVETTETYAAGATPEYKGETPVKAEDDDYTYEFKGWTPEIVAVTGEATYTAEFTAVPKVQYYAITLYVDGQEYDVVENVVENTAIETAIAAVTAPTKEADETNTYAFDGWYTDKECTTKLVAADVVTGHTSLYGQFIATPVEPEVPAVKVTFVNGAEATEVEAVDGVVALPAAPATIGLTAEESASGLYPTNSVLKFVGWANADDTVLYTANLTEVAENITLYAKFESNFVKGDVTGDGKVNIPDRAQIIPYVTKNGTQAFGNVGKTIHPLIPDVAGDVTNDKKVNIPDRAQIIPYVTKNGAQMFGSVGNKIYFINK